MRDVPERRRPRELLDRLGPHAVPDDVLLAIILRSGVKGCNVMHLAGELLDRYGTLTALSQQSIDELASIHGMGRVKAQVLRASLELARRLVEEATPEEVVVNEPGEAAAVLREYARPQEREVFWALLLDTKYRLKRAPVEITSGLLDASLVHPREVFREAIRSGSAGVVVAHNHPSGDPTPSSEDVRITRQLVEAGKIINISILDHVILGRRRHKDELDFFSMRESGLVEFEE
jgi:DNA repair protein RadC